MTETVTIPRHEYEAMRARIDDLDDVLAGYAARNGATLPHDLAMRIVAGEHPLRVWREYRQLTAAALAEAAGVSKTYLSAIETGRKLGSLAANKRLAETLRVPVDALLP